MKKNLKKMFVIFVVAVAVLVVLMLLTSGCKTNDNSDVKNFADVVSVDARWEPDGTGSELYLTNLTLRFVNKTPGYQYGDLTIDWGDGRVETIGIHLRSTNGEEATENIWRGERARGYNFKGEITVTVKLTIQFLGYTSPAFPKTVTMRSL